MTNLSPALHAAICALHGESDLDVVQPAIFDWGLAPVIALCPNANPLVRAIAALGGNLPALLNVASVDVSAFNDAIVRLAQTIDGCEILWVWAKVAPAGWGYAYADMLVDAVQENRCSTESAAALIGACDRSAALLRSPPDIAFAIRRWGQADPDAPTAWMDALSHGERTRLLDEVQRNPTAVARCLPWLPPDMANQTLIQDDDLVAALIAFTEASPTARTQHAELLQRIMIQTHSAHLGQLTRLACAMGTEHIWSHVTTLIQTSPDNAVDVVIAAPWNDVPETVRNSIADGNPAIGAARGRCDMMPPTMSKKIAAAFFAALDPMVWDGLNPDMQRQWRHALMNDDMHLAVRSLGLRQEFLSRAPLNDHLVTIACRHAFDPATIYWMLLPIALREINPADSHALIAALPTLPPEPGMFLSIASGVGDPDVIEPADAALRNPDNLAIAITLQRCVERKEWGYLVCTSLAEGLCGRTWDELPPIMSILDANARSTLIPNLDDLVVHLAHPNRREALRHALMHLASLPPNIAIPTHVALCMIREQQQSYDAATVIASALRMHGHLFLTIVDALADDPRTALLPLPEDDLLSEALRTLAHDDPPNALRLTHALHDCFWHEALLALLDALPHHANAVWQALNDDIRREIFNKAAEISPMTISLAIRDPIAALALATMASDDVDLRDASIAALTRRSALIRTIWDTLPQDVRQSLFTHPSIAVFVADISDASTLSALSACRR